LRVLIVDRDIGGIYIEKTAAQDVLCVRCNASEMFLDLEAHKSKSIWRA